MSDVDKEQGQSDPPEQGPDRGEAPGDSVNTEETGSERTEAALVTEPMPASDGTDVEEHDVEQSHDSADSAVTGTNGATAGEATETIKKPAPEDAPAADDGVKQVSRGGGGPRREAFRRYWPFAVLGLATLVLVVGLFLAISGAKDSSPPEGGKPPGPPALGPMETFTDPEGGFTLRYPKAWRRIPVPPETSEASNLRLVLSTGSPNAGPAGSPSPTGEDGMWVRVLPPEKIDQKIAEFDAEIKAIAGDKPCGTEGSACLRQERATVAGLNGARYIYTSPDATSGQNSVHVQYFLRRAAGKLYVLVFQAVPPTDLGGLAPAFDEVLASFQVS